MSSARLDQPRPQGLLLDDFQNGGSIRHFENGRGEGPGDEVEKLSHIMAPTPILEMARAYGLHIMAPDFYS